MTGVGKYQEKQHDQGQIKQYPCKTTGKTPLTLTTFNIFF